jgi:hypothetical protein
MRARLETARTTWGALTGRNRTALGVMLLGAVGIGFGSGILVRGQQLDARDATVEQLDQKLSNQGQEIATLYERLEAEKSSTVAYDQLSNQELQERALALVDEIREPVEHFRGGEDLLLITQEESAGAAEKLWDEITAKETQKADEIRKEFHRDIKVEANLLREEMLSRLSSASRNEIVDQDFESATNIWGMVRIADDLESLASSLPRRPAAD